MGATPALRSLYRDVDFTEFNFTGHMIRGLMARSPRRFDAVAEELRDTWLDRMSQLVEHLPAGRTLLFWTGRTRPPKEGQEVRFGPDPFLVTAEMIARLKPKVGGYAEALVADAGTSEGLSGMIFAPLEAPAAAGVPGPFAHREMAEVVSTELQRLLN